MTDDQRCSEIAQAIIKSFDNGGKLLVCGNGGSADMANHFVAEFVCKFKSIRKALPAISLASNPSVLTSISNDLGYTWVFSRQLEALGRPGDVLITLSTSGTSQNIGPAQLYAVQNGLEAFAFPTKADLDLDTAGCQELHLKWLHKIAGIVEEDYLEREKTATTTPRPKF